MLNECQEYAVAKFLKRYDYSAILDILEEADINSGDLYYLTESCMYSMNFEFKKALNSLNKINDDFLNLKGLSKVRDNLENLINGEVDDILSELIENIRIQIINREYIDFLGRLYRVKEALLKYIFVSTKENKKYKIDMNSYMLSKKNILYTLKKKYNIYNANLIHGVTNYIHRYVRQTKRMDRVLEILNGEKLENLIKLRNDSLIGHGFKGVSKEDIEYIYGNPMEVTKDLVKACELLDLGINIDKYDHINEIAIQLIGNYSNY